VFESRFLPKALLVFLVEDELAERVIETIVDAARTGHESGDGIVWTTTVHGVVHNRTGERLDVVAA
jgi:nitrogen regulatory protein P-II 1